MQWKSGSEDWDATNRQAVSELPPRLTHTIAGLTGGVEHTVRVRAVSASHDGAWSEGSAGTPVGAMQPPQSSDATLTALTLVNAADDAAIALTPGFVSGTESYTADVASGVATATVTATTNHASATFEITPADADSNTPGHQVNLTEGGDTVITVVVTAEDGNTTKTYTVTVTRASLEFDLDSSLTAIRGIWSDGTTVWVLDNRKTLAYAYALDGGQRQDGTGDTTNREFRRPGGNDNAAGVWSDGTTIWVADASDDKVYAYALSGGKRQDGTDGTEDLEFDLHTANGRPTGIWSDGSTIWVADYTDGKALRLRAGRRGPRPGRGVQPGRQTTIIPSASGPTARPCMWWTTWTTRSTPTRWTAGPGTRAGTSPWTAATTQASGAPGADRTTIWVADTADRKLYAYALPDSGDAALSALSLSGVALEPDFDPKEVTYAPRVPHSVESTTVSATVNDPAASRVITPADADSNTNGHQVNLTAGGDTVITVEVTAEDGITTRTYTVTVTRSAAGLSTDATLSALSLSGVTLDDTFAAGTVAYTGEAASDVSSTTVTATPTHPSATRAITPADADSVAAGHQVNLVEGETAAIMVQVTAQDGATRQTYTVGVARAAGVPVVTLALDPATIDEDAGAAVTVTATVSAAQATEFTVTVAAAAVSPATDAAYTLSSNTTLTFTASATGSAGTVTITPEGNSVNELDKVITVSGAVAGVTGVTGPDDVELTITDNDHPVITHTLSLHRDDATKTPLDPAMIPEDVGQVCIRVTATTEADLPPERDSTSTVTTGRGTARSPGDYSAVTQQFFQARSAYSLQSGKHVAVLDECTELRIVDDALDEDNEQFTLYMSPNPGTPLVYEYEYTINNRLTVTIKDDDPEPSLSIADADGAEGADLEFVVTLDPASGREVTVDWAVDEGTATAGDDYTDGSGTLIFAPSDTTKTVTVATLPDTVPEGDETFTVTLSNARNAAIGDADATGTIAANDAVLTALVLSGVTLVPAFDSADDGVRRPTRPTSWKIPRSRRRRIPPGPPW